MEKRGGIRKGAGRKAVPDKKKPLVIYIRPSREKQLGGGKKIKEMLNSGLDSDDGMKQMLEQLSHYVCR